MHDDDESQVIYFIFYSVLGLLETKILKDLRLFRKREGHAFSYGVNHTKDLNIWQKLYCGLSPWHGLLKVMLNNGKQHYFKLFTNFLFVNSP